MAIGTALAIGAGLSALGGILNKRKADSDANKQTQYNQQSAQNLYGLMQRGPTGLEQQGSQMLGGWRAAPQVAGPGYTPQSFDATALLGAQGFNTGQDALMQALRTDPMAKSNQTLQGIISGQGNPFDTTALFQALGAQDQRATNQAVAQTRAGASGLGQRFGSYLARQEGDLRLQAADQAAARNAQIQMQSYGDAQTRLLQAVGQLSGNQQFGAQNQMALAQALQSGALNAGQLGLAGTQANNAAQAQLAGLQQQAGIANQQAGLQGQQSQAQLLQALLAAQQGRQGQNIQLAGLATGAGAPVASQQGWGSVVGGIGSLIGAPGVLKSNPTLVPQGMTMLGATPASYVPLQF